MLLTITGKAPPLLMRNFIIIFTLLLTTFNLHAQQMGQRREEAGSPDTATNFYTSLNQRFPGENIRVIVDTSLTGFQYFLPTESATQLYALTGNAGLAYKSLVFAIPDYTGFRYSPDDFSFYKWKNNNIRYFFTSGPYSRLFYSTGPEKEQLFKVTHAQNVTGGLSIGLDLSLINSLGLYERQKSDNITFAGTAQFISRNDHYVVLGNYHHSKLTWRENGGISKEDMFTQNTESDRKRIPVFLKNAESSNKENGVQIRQFYYPGKLKADTTSSDTSAKARKHRYYDPSRSNFIRHTFTYSKNKYYYFDKNPLAGFYNNIYKDSTVTNDSIFQHEIINDVAIEGGIGKARGSSKAIILRVGIEHTFAKYNTDSITKSFQYITPYGYISANAFGYAKAEGKIWLTDGAPFNGDKGIEGTMLIPGYDNTEKWGNLRVNAILRVEQPYYIYQYHYSNHFSWDNSFGQQTTLSLSSSYEHKFFKAGFNIHNLTDYTYLDKTAMPVKAGSSVAITQLWAYTNIKWRYIESEIYGVFQSSSKSFIHLPQFAGRASINYTRPLFKKALHFQAGVAAMYNTPYYADAYMPALRAFYVQDEKEIGGYPYIDAYINIRVKRARMFALMKHLNSGFMDYNYFLVPGYPMPDAGFRFGVSWAFYD